MQTVNRRGAPFAYDSTDLTAWYQLRNWGIICENLLRKQINKQWQSSSTGCEIMKYVIKYLSCEAEQFDPTFQ